MWTGIKIGKVKVMKKRKVVIITDGDQVAKTAVEQVAMSVGGRCISSSAGNPTPLSGEELVELIMKTPYDPILVMIDDRGKTGQGKGEQVLEHLISNPDIDILGVVAVASNTSHTEEINVDSSVDRYGNVISQGVDKNGFPTGAGLSGDTVEILKKVAVPVIIGTGDTGKMDGCDSVNKGTPVTLKAIKEILSRSGFSV